LWRAINTRFPCISVPKDLEKVTHKNSLDRSAKRKVTHKNSYDDVDEDLYKVAKKIVIEAGRASASLLQRRLRIGYARAARILDIMEDKGIVGPANGAKPREVYLSRETGEEYFSNEEEI